MRRFDKKQNILEANLRVLGLKEDFNTDYESDLKNSNTTERNICDDFSVTSYGELEELINQTHVSKEDEPKVKELMNQLKTDNKNLSNDIDNLITCQHKISSLLCK